jgi:spermidine synthase
LYFVFCSTIFLNAALLFLVQPMIAKMILPYLGGTPAVWNTSLFFFQALLLAGYVYAHLASEWLRIRPHAFLHLALVLGALLALPIAVRSEWFTSADLQPGATVLSVLFVTVGLPFFVLSAGSPLLQKWFANSNHSDAGDPYFLYAASNLGSMVGLAAYPLWLEPYFGLAEQSRVWLYGYLALVFLVSTCVFLLTRSHKPAVEVKWVGSEGSPKDISAMRQAGNWRSGFREARWVLLAFAPSSLLLGVTAYVTTDIASAPLFWIVPLALYLLSFVIAFSRNAAAAHPLFVRRQPFLLTAAAVTLFAKATSPVWLLLPLHLLAFSVTALVCHGELAKDRPPPNRLTEFYVWISLGGVLGGCFNALVAPALFKGVEEYPLAMIVAALMRPPLDGRKPARLTQWLDVVLPCILALLALPLLVGSQQHGLLPPRATHLLIFGASGILCLASARRPLRFAVAIAAVMFVSSLYTGPFGAAVHSARSFFGVYKTVQSREQQAHILFHGSTVHGIQNLDPEKRLQPSSYFHPSGPAGQVFKTFANNRPKAQIAIVGLGVGSLACHARRDHSVTFYEIDPLVERIARNPQLFTFLRDCPPLINVEIGDARISLGEAPARHYDLFVLDAFSSDAIPIHLLTREAIELYLSKLKDDGILLFHISNRYFDLSPVLGEAAASLKLTTLIQHDSSLSDVEARDGKVASRWVVMARATELLSPFIGDGRWQRLDGQPQGALWSDDYSNVLRVLRWN